MSPSHLPFSFAVAVVVALAACTDAPGSGKPADDSGDSGGVDSAGDTAPPCDDPAEWYPDADGDGFGAYGEAVVACEAPDGHVLGSEDCDDTDAYVFPGAPELCDGKGNDCTDAGWTDAAERGVVTEFPEAGVPISHADAWAVGTDTAPVALAITSGAWAICPGTFYVSVAIEGPATLTGWGSDATVLSGGEAGRVLTVTADSVISGLAITEGTSDAEGGLVFVQDASVTVTDAKLSSGRALRGGAIGGVYTGEHTLLLDGVELIGNVASEDGGAIHVEGPVAVTIRDVTAASNAAVDGGALHGTGAGALALEGGMFEGNGATGNGGAVAWDSAPAGAFEVDGTTFRLNTAGGDGGALHVAGASGGGGEAALRDTTFETNAAMDSYGAAYLAFDDVTIDGGLVDGNWSEDTSGGLGLDGARLAVTDTTFSENVSLGAGGGLRLAWTDTATLTGASFRANEAFLGAAFAGFADAAAGALVVSGVTAEGGTAFAGGVAYFFGSRVQMEDVLFSSNEAEDGGALTVESCPEIALGVGVRIEDNTAAFRGGGLFASLSTVTITGDTSTLDGFRRNAASFGGAVCYEPGASDSLSAVDADFGEDEDDNSGTYAGRDVYNLGTEAAYGDGETFTCMTGGVCE